MFEYKDVLDESINHQTMLNITILYVILCFLLTGLLPYQIIIDKTMEFNKYAHMDIPYDVIVRLAQEYKNQRDQVDIFKFLDHLGNRYRWYKA